MFNLPSPYIIGLDSLELYEYLDDGDEAPYQSLTNKELYNELNSPNCPRLKTVAIPPQGPVRILTLLDADDEDSG